MNTLNGLELDDEIEWLDELDWTPVTQTIFYGVTGQQVIQEGIKRGGRPITLRLRMTRDLLDQLRDLFTATDNLELVLYDQTLAVRWRHADGPISATPDMDIVNPSSEPSLYYTATLRFVEVLP